MIEQSYYPLLRKTIICNWINEQQAKSYADIYTVGFWRIKKLKK